jgi:hypothetical protein
MGEYVVKVLSMVKAFVTAVKATSLTPMTLCLSVDHPRGVRRGDRLFCVLPLGSRGTYPTR